MKKNLHFLIIFCLSFIFTFPIWSTPSPTPAPTAAPTAPPPNYTINIHVKCGGKSVEQAIVKIIEGTTVRVESSTNKNGDCSLSFHCTPLSDRKVRIIAFYDGKEDYIDITMSPGYNKGKTINL